MIDDALTRPGRLEVKVEIGLPDAEGRVQILDIHTGGMRKSGRLAADVDTTSLADECKVRNTTHTTFRSFSFRFTTYFFFFLTEQNYTGAEIEGLVRSAGQFAMSRAVDITDLSKVLDTASIKVEGRDFLRAIAETTPAFGAQVRVFWIFFDFDLL